MISIQNNVKQYNIKHNTTGTFIFTVLCTIVYCMVFQYPCLSVTFVNCEYRYWAWHASKNNCMTYYSGYFTHPNHKPSDLSLVEVPQFSYETEVGCERWFFSAENLKYLWNGANLYIPYRLVTYSMMSHDL